MALRTPTRADDEALLAMLAERVSGSSTSAIADARGLTCSNVRTSTNRVRKDDEKAEGCDLSHAYW